MENTTTEVSYITPDMQIKIDEGLRNLIPPLQQVEFEKLRETIESEREITDPIILWKSDIPEMHNTIIDGMHRYSIVQDLKKQGIEIRVPYKYRTFESYAAIKIWMITHQIARRNLTQLQKTEIAVELTIALQEEANRRKLAGVAAPEEEKGKAADIAGEVMKVSGASIERLKAVQKDPEVNQLVKKECIPISMGSELVQLKKKEPELAQNLIKRIDTSASSAQNTKVITPLIRAIKHPEVVEQKREEIFTQAIREIKVDSDEDLDRMFNQYFNEVVKTPYSPNMKGDMETLAIVDAETKKALWVLPRSIKLLMINRRVRYLDIALLLKHNKEITADLTAEKIQQIADELRNKDEQESFEKKKESKERELQKKERELIIQGRIEENDAAIHEAMILLTNFQKIRKEGKMYCPVHGVDCKFLGDEGFECGLSLDAAIQQHKENRINLHAKVVEKQVQETREITLRDGTITKDIVMVTKRVRVPGDVGKKFLLDTQSEDDLFA